VRPGGGRSSFPHGDAPAAGHHDGPWSRTAPAPPLPPVAAVQWGDDPAAQAHRDRPPPRRSPDRVRAEGPRSAGGSSSSRQRRGAYGTVCVGFEGAASLRPVRGRHPGAACTGGAALADLLEEQGAEGDSPFRPSAIAFHRRSQTALGTAARRRGGGVRLDRLSTSANGPYGPSSIASPRAKRDLREGSPESALRGDRTRETAERRLRRRLLPSGGAARPSTVAEGPPGRRSQPKSCGGARILLPTGPAGGAGRFLPRRRCAAPVVPRVDEVIAYRGRAAPWMRTWTGLRGPRLEGRSGWTALTFTVAPPSRNLRGASWERAELKTVSLAGRPAGGRMYRTGSPRRRAPRVRPSRDSRAPDLPTAAALRRRPWSIHFRQGASRRALENRRAGECFLQWWGAIVYCERDLR